MLLTDRQRACGIMPLEGDGGVGALLILIAVAFIFIEEERAVGTRIDTDLKLIPCLLTYILHLGGEGQDAASTYKHRHKVEWSWDGDALSTLVLLISPEIIPCSTFRQVFGGSLWG